MRGFVCGDATVGGKEDVVARFAGVFIRRAFSSYRRDWCLLSRESQTEDLGGVVSRRSRRSKVWIAEEGDVRREGGGPEVVVGAHRDDRGRVQTGFA